MKVLKSGRLSPQTIKRALTVLVGMLLVFAMLLGRILIIQTVDYDRYLSKVIDQMNTQSILEAERGIILDANGEVLATNITTYRVFISPSKISAKQKKDRVGTRYAEDIAKGLSGILELDYEKVYKHTTYTRYLDRTVAKDVSDEKADAVRAFIDENGYHDMIFLEATNKRYYPNGSLGSSVLGFTNTDGVGIYGLEAFYDEALRGTNGYYLTARDSFGNEMPGEFDTYVPAENGSKITTTIDSYIQRALEEQLLAAISESGAQNRACGVVVNVKTGAVLAMATVPGFDLNDPWTLNDYYSNFLLSDGLSQGSAEYEKAYQDYLFDMWRNKAVSDSYIPGSTFKILTSSMALSEGKVNLSGDTVCCGGSLRIFGHTIHCHKRKGHGPLSFAQGLVQSCNVWFMTLGERLGVGRFYDYFRSFGYLEKTGIDLPGEGNSVVKTQNAMTGLDLAIYAFGQNFNITPIQHIMAIAAAANGGYLLDPYLVESITDSDGTVTYSHETQIRRQVISSDVCKTVAEILESGVSGDGGAKNVYVAGYKIAAKTGTSEKKGTEIRVEGVKAYVCSCVAFAPADDPEIAVLMMVDEPSRGVLYGSVVAAPYVGAFLETVLPYIGVQRDEALVNEVSVPNFENMELSSALSWAEELGYKVNVKGDGEYVMSQIPRADALIDKNNRTLTLYTGDAREEGSVAVPSLVGKNAFVANQLLADAGLNVCITGTDNYLSGGGATVVEQSIGAGTYVPEGTVITIRLRYEDPD
ncbi:MAG: PASTA domain-containing protein [Clostridia bacterium]|nr:PASTA domain-containing protein [Clostridia bacterium]